MAEPRPASPLRRRDAAAEKVIDTISSYLPDFRARILDRAVFSSDHFASMHGATEGDFTHGLIHPENMLGERAMVPGFVELIPVNPLMERVFGGFYAATLAGDGSNRIRPFM